MCASNSTSSIYEIGRVAKMYKRSSPSIRYTAQNKISLSKYKLVQLGNYSEPLRSQHRPEMGACESEGMRAVQGVQRTLLWVQ